MSVTTEKPADATAIRPFQADIPDEAIVDVRRRIAATRWPDKETVADQSQGAQLDKLQALVRYWGTGYQGRRLALDPGLQGTKGPTNRPSSADHDRP
jgi:hypothetical protein